MALGPNDPIGVRDWFEDPSIGFTVFILFARALVLGALAAHIASSAYGCGLAALYMLTKLGELVVNERARAFSERATVKPV